MTFRDGLAVLGTTPVNNLGIATFTTSALPASLGPQTINAFFTPVSGGNDNPSDSTASPVSQSVNPALLSVTAVNQTREYGDPNPTLTVQYTGFQNGETLATSGVTGRPRPGDARHTPPSPVSGSPYPIAINTGTLSSGNYTFQVVDGQLTINKATLTVKAVNQSPLRPPPTRR